jgi:[acyl-carrier-protein] S-malonyltransferase
VLALVFPGQGSQEVGMAGDFCARYPIAKRTFEEADAALGWALSRRIAEGPEEELRRTEVQQPAVLTASVAMYRVLAAELSDTPVCLAGHSLGEYTALVAAGALELADAVRLVQQRGALMQEAVPEGRGDMAAVLGIPSDAVERACAEAGGAVTPANYNAPEQTVIAGERDAVRAAGELAKKAGARRVLPLQVSAPFHCPLMRPAMEKLAPVLAETPFHDLRVPVVSNVTAEPYHRAADVRELLRQQVCAPVQWVKGVRRLRALGAKLVVEVGPGKVLSGLVGRIEPELARVSLCDVEALARVHAALAEARA